MADEHGWRIADWLQELGLGQYETIFRENGVDASVLAFLTAEDLREIGVVAVGHRRKLLEAISGLSVAGSGGAGGISLERMATQESVAAAAERRQVTVFFCDLVDSTALSAKLDPEDLRAVMASYYQVISEAVQHQAGYVAQFSGDGVLCSFGWPAAHEDDAERAVWAALAAVQAVARLSNQACPLAVRVGIATGPVVAGDQRGEGSARQLGVVGETPNLAARLQALAEPGAIVADAITRRLTGDLFSWADLGEMKLKGLPAPVRAWRALGQSGIESRFEALRSGRARPLVGRHEELELLLRRWQRARAGDGQVVLLRGEAGIGKSRLTAALQEALRTEKHEGFILYGSPQHTERLLHPIVARLERAAGLGPGDTLEQRIAKLEVLLTPLNPPAEDVSLIAELLSVPTQGRWPVLELSPQRRRERLMQSLLRRVRALAARQPVLAVMEDAHWVDPTTRELLDLLITETASMSILLLITYRPEFDHSAWIGMPYVSLMQLNRLAWADNRSLVRLVAGKELPVEVEADILSRSNGVPLFIEEMTRAALEGGLLREEKERWVVEGSFPPLMVPASLQASLVARLDRLSSVREVAQAGAVLARDFPHDLLADITRLPEPALQETIERLIAADLLQRRGIAPEAVYTFRHALIQDAAYGTLLREHRRELHRRAADAIERLQPDVTERQPGILAHHRAEAGDADVAATLYAVAAQQALAHAALAEARGLLRRGQGLLPEIGDTALRARAELDLCLTTSQADIVEHGYAAADTGSATERAVELSAVANDLDRRCRAIAGRWTFLAVRAEMTAAHELAQKLLEEAQAKGEPSIELAAAWQLGYSLLMTGRPGAAKPYFEAVVRLSDRPEALRYQFELGHAAPVAATLYLGYIWLSLGKPDRAAQLIHEGMEQARQLGHEFTLAFALSTSLRFTTRTCSDTFVSLLEEHSKLVDEKRFPHHQTMIAFFGGWRGGTARRYQMRHGSDA